MSRVQHAATGSIHAWSDFPPLPIGVLAFPGTGIEANLADKAWKLGIPVWNYGEQPLSAQAKDGA